MAKRNPPAGAGKLDANCYQLAGDFVAGGAIRCQSQQSYNLELLTKHFSNLIDMP